jgi:2-polyprenyl-3-methyl-5-hydroxy-6-metoxy-1,4-benzoquinol methylase
VTSAKENAETVAPKTSACPICGASAVKLYLNGPPHALDPAAFGSSRTELSFGRILRCSDCGFGFSESRPTEGQLRELYCRMDVSAYERETRGRLRTAQRHQKILQRHYASQPGRILDIGCASGGFLERCAAAGWTVVGLEPSQNLSKEAQQLLGGGARILPITLQEADFAESTFDAVTMWDVLEHVPNPPEFLQKAVSLLKPGGLLLANVPNLDSWQARVMQRRWPLFLPEHLNYFNRESLARCGTQSGARLIAQGSRPVSFSIGYILHRTGQHIPPLRPLAKLTSRSPVADWVVPVWMGELYAVWSATPEAGGARRSER